MSSGKDQVRDMRHGRQGGHWVDAGRTEARFDRPCKLCGAPVVTGKLDHHLTCCAEDGGLARGNGPCNPHTFTDGARKIAGCGFCYLGGEL